MTPATRRGAIRVRLRRHTGMPVGVDVDAAVHADAGQQWGEGEAIDPSLDEIPRQVAGEQQGGVAREQGMREVVHRIAVLRRRLCVSVRCRV